MTLFGIESAWVLRFTVSPELHAKKQYLIAPLNIDIRYYKRRHALQYCRDNINTTSVICSNSTVFALLSLFSMFQQNCRQSFIMPSSILDTDPMSKNDCDIKADKYLQVPNNQLTYIAEPVEYATILTKKFTLSTNQKQSTTNMQSLIVTKLIIWSI